ncbi:glycosyltransferase, partial [Mycobacterium sp. E3251]
MTKFALAGYGTRGDIEPLAAVGRELLRRGHDVAVAVPPELMGFAESTGLAAVPYGPELHDFLDEEFLRNMWAEFFRNIWTIRSPIRLMRKVWEPLIRHWGEVSAALTSLAADADLLCTGLNFEQAAANVAEHYNIPLATLHYIPMRPNGQLIPMLPGPMVRTGMA